MKKFVIRGIVFIFLFLLIFQIGFAKIFKTDDIYDYRVDYDVFKDYTDSIEAVFEVIADDIESNKIDKYIVILGDSVGYSSPGSQYESIGYYMNKLLNEDSSFDKVYNLAIPSMQMGDIYVMLKLMDKYSISSDNLIINTIYPGFINSVPYSTPVFWMKDYLCELDRETYDKVYTEFYPQKESNRDYYVNTIKHYLNTRLSILRYRDYFKGNLNNAFVHDTEKIVQAWNEKPFLFNLMKQDDYKYIYTDLPFTFNNDVPQIFFIEKILQMQRGKNTLFFLAAMNDELLGDNVKKEGYISNMEMIDNYFNQKKEIKYVNYNGKIDYKLFSDHIHLIPKGYEMLAEDLYERIKN